MSQSYEPIGRKSLIRQGLPVPCLGLDFYPILMSHYEEFLACKDSLELRLATLPVKYVTKDYFSALFSLEMDSYAQSGKAIGILSKFLRLFCLSLRIDGGTKSLENAFQYEEVNGEIRIRSFNVTQNQKTVSVTPLEISSQIRPLIAEINGVKLPDESENLDLVIANEQKKEQNASSQKLNASTDDLISSVAYQSHCTESEICFWTVREFEQRKRAIERDKRYMLHGQAEMSGMVTFKKGNPAPSWCYDVLDESLGTQSLSELNFGNAKQKET